jgi:hypothetical protein
MLYNATDLGITQRYQVSAAAAKVLDLSVLPLGVREPEGFDEAFAAMARDPPDGLFMVTDALTSLNRRRVFDPPALPRKLVGPRLMSLPRRRTPCAVYER